MTLGSLFDGSGTCPLAATLCGIKPVWASEIEPYPIRVTRKNFPEMQHLGDITQLNGAEIEPVDIVTFGSPCQDLSEAGAQKGLVEGERSSLFFDAIRIICEMREATHGKNPRYAVWENVPGAFSSNQGRDFLAVLHAFVEAAGGDGTDVPEPAFKGGKLKWENAGCIVGEGYSIAWRVLDAQYWGVPQRRRRIFLVCDFAGERAGEILFKREGLRGDFTQSRAARKETAADAVGSTGGSCGTVVYQNPKRGEYVENEVCSTLLAHLAVEPRDIVVYDARGNGDGTHCPTLTGDHENRVTDYTTVCCEEVFPQVTGCLCANTHPGGVTGQDAFNDMLPVTPGKPPRKYLVRRLTPLECCRLQGFPDWWETGVEGSDSARYKMWGNGMALPCVLYVMEGITGEV